MDNLNMKLQINESYNIEFKQFRWLNGLWIKFYFNQEKILPNGLGDKLGNRLGDAQQYIVSLIQNNPKISITIIAPELNISTTAIDKHIKRAKYY